MPQVTSHKPGAFCWVELATTDANAAKSFYTSLFGWAVNEVPMGDQGTYYMFQKGGRDAAAMYVQGEQEKGIPPHWNNYVAVANVDSATAKAKSLGATVLGGPFDVMDVGRMSFIQDPQGATLALWQAKNSIGAEVNNESGALCWNELYTPDIDASRKFYTGLFGWKLKVSPEYTEVYNGETAIGGMMQITPEMQGMPPVWMPYFMVDDVDATAKKAASSRGRITMPARDLPNVGRFAMLSDPAGANFFVFKPAM